MKFNMIIKNRLIIFLSGVLLSSIVIGIVYSNRYHNIYESYDDKLLEVSSERNYLEQCLKYRNNIGDYQIQVGSEKDIVLYYQRGVCSTCIKNTLHILTNEYDITERVVVAVGDSAGLVFLDRINDAFQYSYDSFVTSAKPLENLNEVLLFKLSDNRVQAVLKYRHGDDERFMKYFSELYL